MWRFAEGETGWYSGGTKSWVDSMVCKTQIAGPDHSNYFERYTSYIKIIKPGYYRLTFSLQAYDTTTSRCIAGIFQYDNGSYYERASASAICGDNLAGASRTSYMGRLEKDTMWYPREWYKIKYLADIYTWFEVEYLGDVSN